MNFFVQENGNIALQLLFYLSTIVIEDKLEFLRSFVFSSHFLPKIQSKELHFFIGGFFYANPVWTETDLKTILVALTLKKLANDIFFIFLGKSLH